MAKQKLSQAFAKDAQEGAYWHTEHPKGLGLIVRPTGTKSWVLQKSGRKRWTLGHYPVIGYADAKKHAERILLAHDPLAEVPAPTLKEALDRHLQRMERRGNTSGALVESEVNLHLKDWLHLPLDQITRQMCDRRHQLLGKRGRSLADRVMRHLSAIWGTALKVQDLPTNPTIAVEPFNSGARQYPRLDIKAFHEDVRRAENPIIRAWYTIGLATGLRRSDLSALRWADVNEDSIWRPNPKGGPKKAFRIPITEEIISVLESLDRDGEWVFPGRLSGHIKAPRKSWLPNAHWLRHEYIAIATDLGVPTYAKKLLVNHSVPKADLTDGYVADPNVELCRPFQERISKVVFAGYKG